MDALGTSILSKVVPSSEVYVEMYGQYVVDSLPIAGKLSTQSVQNWWYYIAMATGVFRRVMLSRGREFCGQW